MVKINFKEIDETELAIKAYEISEKITKQIFNEIRKTFFLGNKKRNPNILSIYELIATMILNGFIKDHMAIFGISQNMAFKEHIKDFKDLI